MINLRDGFDRQVNNLTKLGYSPPNTDSLKEELTRLKLPEIDLGKGTLPFVIVVKNAPMPGVTKLYPLNREDFESTIEIPNSDAYLLLDIDRGKKTINIPPAEALKTIISRQRSPLTIDEGIAIITQFPEFLMKNNCFSLLASRKSGDKRVPAIWISEGKPKLGWCWEGNPHTWLGSASCLSRI